MTVDFAATWSSSDDVRYLGLYGWAYFKQDKIPTKRENGSSASFSNQIEWYIIQDRGSYNPTSSSDCKAYGDATIDGIAYDFKVCDRIGQPMLTGNGNFKQFFSVPKSTGSHRRSGVIDVSAHFKAWHSANMYMDGPLYEVAMKIESYKCNNNQAQGSGSGSVTKNILTIGGTSPGGGNNITLTATASPTTGGSVDKNPDKTSYTLNDKVKLTARPSSGYTFDHWSGGATGTKDTVTVTMNESKTVTAVFTPASGNTTNLIKNGTFTSKDEWTLNTWQNSAGTFAVSGGEARITGITRPSGADAANYSLQLVQAGITLIQGQKYRLTFDASAASARTIDLVMQMDDDPWTTYYSKDDISLTTAWQPFTYNFEMTDPTDENARIAFNFGGATPNVNIKNVSLVYITGSTAVNHRKLPAAGKVSSLRATAQNSAVNVNFRAPAGGETVLKLYTLKGDVISTARMRTVSGESYSHTFTAGKLPNGFYIVSVRNGGTAEQARVIMPK